MGSKTEENFISFLDKVPSLIKEIKDKKLILPPKFNIADCIGELYDEVKNSQIIKKMLRIEFTHDNKQIYFSKLFIDYLNTYHLSENNKIKYSSNSIKVETEVSTATGRRIDILMTVDENEIIIENKINAYDQENQLNDYYKDRNKNVYVLYLTRYASDTSEYSLSKENREELGEKFICISHGDIWIWLENILNDKEYQFIKTYDKYKFIYSALIQVIENEKILGGISKEDDVEKKEIETYLNKFIEDNNIIGVCNLEEYSEIFKNAYNFIKYKSYDKDYYKEIYRILKDEYKLESITFYNGDWELDIAIDKPIQTCCIQVKEGIKVLIQLSNARRWCGVEYNYYDIKLREAFKLIFKELEILGFRGCSPVWVASDIFQEKETPKQIADKMYNLYKLLKDKEF